MVTLAETVEQDLLNHFENVKKERQKKGVNNQILWMEYLETYPDGYKYSQYCNLLKKHLNNTDSAFHWEYNPGEFIQIDFAGLILHRMKINRQQSH